MEPVCEIYVDNYPELYQEKIVTARKQHQCCECGEVGRRIRHVQDVLGVLPDSQGLVPERVSLWSPTR